MADREISSSYVAFKCSGVIICIKHFSRITLFFEYFERKLCVSYRKLDKVGYSL